MVGLLVSSKAAMTVGKTALKTVATMAGKKAIRLAD